MNFIYFWLISGEFKFNRECHQNFYYRDIMERLNAFLLINGASTKTIFCYFLWSVAYMHSWFLLVESGENERNQQDNGIFPQRRRQHRKHRGHSTPPPAALCRLSSVCCRLTSVISPPSSAVHRPPPTAFGRLSSVVRHLSSVRCPLSAALCRLARWEGKSCRE